MDFLLDTDTDTSNQNLKLSINDSVLLTDSMTLRADTSPIFIVDVYTLVPLLTLFLNL